MSLIPNKHCPFEHVKNNAELSPQTITEPTDSKLETQHSSKSDTSVTMDHENDDANSTIESSLENSKLCMNGSENKCSVSTYDSLWPDVAEGQKIRVLKNSTLNDTFARKLQVGMNWRNMLRQSAGVPCPEKNIRSPVNPSTLLSCRNDFKNVIKESPKLKSGNVKVPRLPPNDSGVHLIDCSLKEKLTQPDVIQNSQTKSKVLPQLETDFPDLSAALKMLSKSSVRNEGSELITESKEIISNKRTSKRKAKSNQPCRKDPISINIVDYLKETCETSKRHSLIDRRIQLRDMEKRKICGNILDSSNPIRKRGKYREKPAKKRLSKLKQVIMNERDKKKEQKGINLNMIANKTSDPDMECVGAICSQLNSLQIVNENSDTKVACSVPAKLELKLREILKGEETLRPHETHKETSASPIAHSRKFRNYCNNIRCLELDEATTNLLKEIYRFQDRLHKKDPIRAHAKRRFILGIREVKKFLMLKKLKAIIVAPDLEPVEGPGGLDETIVQIREEGRVQQVPVIFAVGRRQLGFTLRKKVPISVIGIINAEGAEELYQLMLKEWHDALQKYQEKKTIS